MKKENKTALDQLFGEYVKLYPDLFEKPTHETIKIINLFVKYSCVEEKQIMDAFNTGEYYSADYFDAKNPNLLCSQNYYNEKYTTKE